MPQHPALSKGTVPVITGGASGIGLAAARRFAAFGMKLVLADLSQDALDRAAAQLSGAELVTVPTDVSEMNEVSRLKDRAYAAFGAVDVLMNNAGTCPDVSLLSPSRCWTSDCPSGSPLPPSSMTCCRRRRTSLRRSTTNLVMVLSMRASGLGTLATRCREVNHDRAGRRALPATSCPSLTGAQAGHRRSS